MNKMNKTGILWKLRLPENEISIAEESGPVRTFKCLHVVFEKLRKEEVREGCYIQANFNMEKRMITKVERIMLEGFVTKWAPKYAFVHTPILPQIKLSSSSRVAEIKFIHNPPSSLSSTYLDTADCSFQLENNMAIRFSLMVNLKKTSKLRNAPYCDLKAVQVQQLQNSANSACASASSSADTESRLTSWLDRRMSSPKVSRSPGRRTPEKRLLEAPSKFDMGSRKRGSSTPVKKHLGKRDPARVPQSAPVTPVKGVLHPDSGADLQKLSSRLQSVSRPQSATTQLEGPPKSLDKRCLRCQKEKVEECTHKPPHSREIITTTKEPKSQAAEKNLQEENDRLRQVVDDLRLQLSQSLQNSHPNVQQSYHGRPKYQTPSLNVSYDQAIKHKNYDTIFAHSPSVSPSSSPVPEMFSDPEKLIPGLFSGGKPSSTRSDVMGPTHKYDPILHHHYGTPLTNTMHFNEPDDFFAESSRSSTTTPSWPSHGEMTPHEFMDYYERRKSPRVSEASYVPPLELPPSKLVGERRAHSPAALLPLLNADPNRTRTKPDNSRWATVGENDLAPFKTPMKKRYTKKSSSYKKSKLKQPTPYQWEL